MIESPGRPATAALRSEHQMIRRGLELLGRPCRSTSCSFSASHDAAGRAIRVRNPARYGYTAS